jgi:hypothetical protein
MAATLFLVGFSRKCSDNITVDGAPVWVLPCGSFAIARIGLHGRRLFYSTIELAHQAGYLNRTELKRYRRKDAKQRENPPTSRGKVLGKSAGDWQFVNL